MKEKKAREPITLKSVGAGALILVIAALAVAAVGLTAHGIFWLLERGWNTIG